MRRRIGVVVGAVAVPLLLVGCIAVPRGDSRPQRLPIGIPERAVEDCEQSVGLGGSAPVTAIYRDGIGLHVRIGNGTQFAVGSGGGMSATESALLSCLTVAASSLPAYPRDSAGLLQQWKYSDAVLWPCFAQHGIDIGPTPSRATFLGGDPVQMDPLQLLRAPISERLRQRVQRDCPLVPAYLSTGSSSTGSSSR